MSDDDGTTGAELWLAPEVTATVRDIQEELRTDPQDDSNLQLAGLEVILVPLALKFVVGVVSSFLGRAAYDRWKGARTRKKLEELAGQLQFEVGDPGSVVDEKELHHDLVETFVAEGLSTAQAIRVVDRSLARMKENKVRGR